MVRRAGSRTDDRPRRAEATTRLCAANRTERPVEELIRFVAAPDGVIVPDPAHRLPGRGVWVAADRKSVARAVETKAFGRSLRRQVAVPADLAAEVERLLERRALDALSIATKAGLVTAGFEKVDSALAKGEVVALLHASDAAADGCGKLDRKFRAIRQSDGRDAPIYGLFTVEQISLAIGRASVVHAALKSGGAAERFLFEARRLDTYRAGLPAAQPAEPA